MVGFGVARVTDLEECGAASARRSRWATACSRGTGSDFLMEDRVTVIYFQWRTGAMTASCLGK
jgi:hypothetical protein